MKVQIIEACCLIGFLLQVIANPITNPSAELKEVVDSNWKICVDLYKQLSQSFQGKSIFFSPQCVASSLMMLHMGARGETAQQIQNALAFPKGINDKHGEAQDMILTMLSNQSNYQFSRVETIFLQNGFKVEPQFQNPATQYYKADIKMMPFEQDPTSAKNEMNAWIAKNTDNHITNLIFKDITAMTRFVLASAMEFQSTWNRRISPQNTTLKVFNGITGPTKPIPMMSFVDTFFYWSDPASNQVIELPFAGDKHAVYILLPSPGSNIMDLEKKLYENGVRPMITNLSPVSNLRVVLPKLAFNLSYDLKPQLMAMGMNDMFDQDKADFSGLVSGLPHLPLDYFFHQARTGFQDEGQEPTPAIEVPPFDASTPPQVFEANRPFLFLIICKTSQSPIFAGRYMGE